MDKLAVIVLLLGAVLVLPALGFRNLPTSEITTSNFACPTEQQEQTVSDSVDSGIRSEVQATVLSTLTCRLGECESNPASSCQKVLDYGPAVSGWYWLRRCDGTHVQTYCAMNNPCGCSGTRAWTRIGLLNMSDPTDQCPPGMGLIANPRSCSRNVFPGN